MANEITVNDTLSITQSGVTDSLTKSFSVSMTGSAKDQHTQNFTDTAALIIPSAAVLLEGITWFKLGNPDLTSILLVSLDNGTSFPIQILPGEMMGAVRLNVAATVDPLIKVKTKVAASTVTNAPILFLGT
jgi:hypothetical protein